MPPARGMHGYGYGSEVDSGTAWAAGDRVIYRNMHEQADRNAYSGLGREQNGRRKQVGVLE